MTCRNLLVIFVFLCCSELPTTMHAHYDYNSYINRFCADEINTESICATEIGTGVLCSESTQTRRLCADHIATQTICSQVAHIDVLCVNNLHNYTRYKAHAKNRANQSYRLGSLIEFDSIVDDPNNNISLNPFSAYTVPESGYYSLCFSVAFTDLAGTSAPTGTPVAHPHISVNGAESLSVYQLFLSLNASQFSTVSGLLFLHAGDVVQFELEVLFMDQANNLVPYSGTGTLLADQTYAVIHYLSSANLQER